MRYAVLVERLAADCQAGRPQFCEVGDGASGVVEALATQASRLRYLSVGAAEPQQRRLAACVAELRSVSALQACDWLLADHIPEGDEVVAWLRGAWALVRRGLMFRLQALPGSVPLQFPVPLDTLAALLHEMAGHRIRIAVDYAAGEILAFAERDEPLAGFVPSPMPELLPQSVPVCRPLMAPAERLLPYLRVLDQTRQYSNYGPLVQRFETRLAAVLGQPRETVTTASSGTAALVGAILSLAGRAGPQRPLCAMPSYTFVATAVAAEHCGYQPLLLDVGEDWQLLPEAVAAHPEFARIGLVLPVAPYGRALRQAPWQAFVAATGIPVVIDGAACFEALQDQPAEFLGTVPVALSLHATKALATGEGGAILCSQAEVIARAVQTLNFGFRLTREARAPGSNGKMSEYHAAVGLAELDGWDDKRARYAAVAQQYRAQAAAAGLEARLRLAPLVASNYALLQLDDEAQTQRVRAALTERRAEHRLWYGPGLHRQPYYADCPATAMPVTDALAPTLLGLPMSVDLGPRDIGRCLDAVAAALADG